MIQETTVRSAEELLRNKISASIIIQSHKSIGGGDINEAYRLDTSDGPFFMKLNSRSRYPYMFEREANGLEILKKHGKLRIPDVIAFGENADDAFLLLEHISSAAKDENYFANLGRGLAYQHKKTAKYFGLDDDNYIGSLQQSNRHHASWAEFFAEERLRPQMRMARDRGVADSKLSRSFESLFIRLEEIFPEEPPALLHGDLWGGNIMSDEKGCPVLIDPAVYYGHREMDLGMSRLFGGFSPGFYEEYHSVYPLEKGWQQRIEICNLYPLMVHVNLFGGAYLASVKSISRKF